MAVNAHTWAAPRISMTAPGAETRRRRLAVDGAIALALFTYSVVIATQFPPPPPYGWRGYLTILALVVLPLAGRRVWPGAVHTIVPGVMALGLALKLPGASGNTALIALMISTYSFAAYARTSRPWIGWPMTFPVFVLVVFKPGFQRTAIPILVLEMGMAWYFGRLQRQRVSLAAALDHRALQLQSSPEDVERLAVNQERGRIARDLQLLVTAAVDAMVAGARDARALVRDDVARAEAGASTVADTGRAALHEMRRLLDLLRGRGSDHLQTPPSLEALTALAESAGPAGVEVRVALTGDTAAVAMPSQRAAFRVAEEAVAMAMDRGDGHVLDLRIEASGQWLRIHAGCAGGSDRDPLPVPPFDPRVAGLHERVALLGGELRTRLDDDGAFELEAKLPGHASRDIAAPLLLAERPSPEADAGDGSPHRSRGSAVLAAIRQRAWLQDLVLVASLVAVSIWEVLYFPEPSYDAVRGWKGALGLVAIASTLLLRRRAPVGALLLAGAVQIGRDLLMLRWTNGILLILSIHIFTVASRRSPRLAAAAVGVAVVGHGIFLGRVIEGVYRSGHVGVPASGATMVVFAILLRIVGMWIFAAFAGRTLRARDELNGRLARRVEHLVEYRDIQARLAIAEERRRVARELHDVVAHGLSVMVLQSGVAGSLVRRDPARAEEALALVERLGQEAHGELQVLVALLGPDGTPPATGAPKRIEELVADARAGGLDVALTTEGDRELGDHLSLHAYRIVQEALTNARKHAAGAPVRVRVAYLDGGIEVEVVNAAPRLVPARPSPVPGGGNGLLGMRERVGLFGGDLVAGPRADGGFEVRARIPEPVLA